MSASQCCHPDCQSASQGACRMQGQATVLPPRQPMQRLCTSQFCSSLELLHVLLAGYLTSAGLLNGLLTSCLELHPERLQLLLHHFFASCLFHPGAAEAIHCLAPLHVIVHPCLHVACHHVSPHPAHKAGHLIPLRRCPWDVAQCCRRCRRLCCPSLLLLDPLFLPRQQSVGGCKHRCA